MNMNNVMRKQTPDARELDMRQLDAVSGGMLPAVMQNVINKIACEVRGGDYYQGSGGSTCAGPQG
jgi:hypothetical protein